MQARVHSLLVGDSEVKLLQVRVRLLFVCLTLQIVAVYHTRARGMICPSASDPLEEIMGWVGTAAALLLFLVPLSTMRAIRRRGSVAEYSCVPYTLSLAQCMLWATYALPMVTPCKTQPLITNSLGTALELGYVLVFLRYAGARRKEITVQVLGMLVGFCAIVLFALLAAPHIEGLKPFPPETPPLSRQTTVLGFVAAISNVGMYAAPLSAMRQVVRTRSVEFMPLSLTLATGGCSVAWMVWALKAGDDFVLAPNVAGVLLTIAQLVLYVRFCGQTKKLALVNGGEALISPAANVPVDF